MGLKIGRFTVVSGLVQCGGKRIGIATDADLRKRHALRHGRGYHRPSTGEVLEQFQGRGRQGDVVDLERDHRHVEAMQIAGQRLIIARPKPGDVVMASHARQADRPIMVRPNQHEMPIGAEFGHLRQQLIIEPACQRTVITSNGFSRRNDAGKCLITQGRIRCRRMVEATLLDGVRQVKHIRALRQRHVVQPARDASDQCGLLHGACVQFCQHFLVIRKDRKIVDPVVDDGDVGWEPVPIIVVVGERPEHGVMQPPEQLGFALEQKQSGLDFLQQGDVIEAVAAIENDRVTVLCHHLGEVMGTLE